MSLYDKNAIEFEEAADKQDDEKMKLKKLLNMSVNEIELSVRAANCLNNANITTVGQLAMKSEQEMLKYRNFGKKSLNEIKDKLTGSACRSGMNFEPGLIDSAEGRTGGGIGILCVILNERPNWAAPPNIAMRCWRTSFAA